MIAGAQTSDDDARQRSTTVTANIVTPDSVGTSIQIGCVDDQHATRAAPDGFALSCLAARTTSTRCVVLTLSLRSHYLLVVLPLAGGDLGISVCVYCLVFIVLPCPGWEQHQTDRCERLAFGFWRLRQFLTYMHRARMHTMLLGWLTRCLRTQAESDSHGSATKLLQQIMARRLKGERGLRIMLWRSTAKREACKHGTYASGLAKLLKLKAWRTDVEVVRRLWMWKSAMQRCVFAQLHTAPGSFFASCLSQCSWCLSSLEPCQLCSLRSLFACSHGTVLMVRALPELAHVVGIAVC